MAAPIHKRAIEAQTKKPFITVESKRFKITLLFIIKQIYATLN